MSVSCDCAGVRFTDPAVLRRFIGHWPALESLSIVGHRIFMPTPHNAPSRDLLINNTNLSSLTLEPYHWSIRRMDDLLTSVPPSLRSLRLDVDFFNQDDLDAQLFAIALKDIAPQLEDVVLLCEKTPRDPDPFPIPLDSRLDELVERLVNATRLVLPTHAVGHWPTALKPLKALTDLELVQADERYFHRMGHQDLIDVCTREGAKLRRVALAARAWDEWDQEEQVAVVSALTTTSIGFTVV